MEWYGKFWSQDKDGNQIKSTKSATVENPTQTGNVATSCAAEPELLATDV